MLNNGTHEEERDEWDNKHQAWNYAIKGSTMEARELRVVVTIIESKQLLLITIYDLGKKR